MDLGTKAHLKRAIQFEREYSGNTAIAANLEIALDEIERLEEEIEQLKHKLNS